MQRRWRKKAIPFLQLAAAVILTAAALYLLCRYAQYGQKQKETVAGTSDGEGQTAGRETDFRSDPGRKAEGLDGSLPDTILVRIMGSDFQDRVHERVVVSCKKGFSMEVGQRKKAYASGETLTVQSSELEQGEILMLEGNDEAALCIESIERGDGIPQYKGKLYLIREEEGISVINEIALEEYLYSVVSSEMPSDYPEEALKAQAVCARTYAVNCIRNRRDGTTYEDVDDSVSYQVYNNQKSTKRSRKAVKETSGEILPLEEIQYYSTSCLSKGRTDLDQEEKFREFLSSPPQEGAEYHSPWLRWSVGVPAAEIAETLQAEYGTEASAEGSSDSVNKDQEILRIDSIVRRGDGQIQSMTVSCGGQSYPIEGEYNVRRLLGSARAEIQLQDGTQTSGMQLLPSAYFYLDNAGETKGQESASKNDETEAGAETKSGVYEYQLNETVWFTGGGYGHGNGMSQYGAAGMASEGLDYKEILEYYYQVSVISNP